MLTILKQLPDRFLDVGPTELPEILDGPTLIHLDGARQPALFVSILLHGHEVTGFEAVQALLRKYQGKELPRALTLFVGNVQAAGIGKRLLEGQPDFNRIWQEGPLPEQQMTQQVLAEIKQRGVFAAVDVHNNSGRNPHYACVTSLNHYGFHLATLFSRTVIYFTKPTGVLNMAFHDLCPAVTIECGQPGHDLGRQHALDYLEACLHLSEIPEHPVAPHDIDLFHSMATITVPEMFSFGFEETGKDLSFIPELDQLNFQELSADTLLGTYKPHSHARLLALDEWEHEVTERYFSYENNEIRTKIEVMPSMFTLDPDIIRQDCLGYLMERLPLPEPGQAPFKIK